MNTKLTNGEGKTRHMDTMSKWAMTLLGGLVLMLLGGLLSRAWADYATTTDLREVRDDLARKLDKLADSVTAHVQTSGTHQTIDQKRAQTKEWINEMLVQFKGDLVPVIRDTIRGEVPPTWFLQRVQEIERRLDAHDKEKSR